MRPLRRAARIAGTLSAPPAMAMTSGTRRSWSSWMAMQRSGRPAARTWRPSASSTMEHRSATPPASSTARASAGERAARIVEAPGSPRPDAHGRPGQRVEHADRLRCQRVPEQCLGHARALHEQRHVEREDRAGGAFREPAHELQRVGVEVEGGHAADELDDRAGGQAGQLLDHRVQRPAPRDPQHVARPRGCRRGPRRRPGPAARRASSSGPAMVRTTTAPRIPCLRATSSARARSSSGSGSMSIRTMPSRRARSSSRATRNREMPSSAAISLLLAPSR